MLMLSTAFRRELGLNGMKLGEQDWSGCRDGKTLFLVFDVAERGAALRVLREVVPKYITGFIELGDFDPSDRIWRTVFWTGDKKPMGAFSRFLSDEFIEACLAYSDYDSKTAHKYFQQEMEKIWHQPPRRRIAAWLRRAAMRIGLSSFLSLKARKDPEK
jgi:hypothetical protein